jgi:threonine efflux protein
MQSWTHLLPILGLWTLTVISPGPDTLAVVSTSLARSRAAGIAVAIGCAVATLIWASASLTGLSILFERAQWLYHLIRLAGAIYLIVLGGLLIRSAWAGRSGSPHGEIDAGARPLGRWRAFRLGLLTDLSNPKAAAFFASLFAVALPPDADAELKILVVLAVGGIAGTWYVIVAATVSLAPVARLYARGRRFIEAGAGMLFIGFGAKIATDR